MYDLFEQEEDEKRNSIEDGEGTHAEEAENKKDSVKALTNVLKAVVNGQSAAKNDLEVIDAMSGGSDPDGGLTVPKDISTKIKELRRSEDGYDIYLDGKKCIEQHEPHIPYPNSGYEQSCLKQIGEICNPVDLESQKDDTQKRLSALEAQNNEVSATLDDILTNIIPALIEAESEEK